LLISMRSLSPGFSCQAPSSVRALTARKAPHRPESGFWVPRDTGDVDEDRPAVPLLEVRDREAHELGPSEGTADEDR
jgi:hypothetical protein